VSAIEEAKAGLEAAKEHAETAWQEASQAKETAAETIDMILNVTGPDLPELASIPFNMIQEAQNQIEQAQALLSSAQEALEEYSNSLG